MSDGLTICVIGLKDSYYGILDACLESCLSISSDVLFVDIGAPESVLDEMSVYRGRKRAIPTVSYDSVNMMLLSMIADSGWLMLMFPDEVVHDASWHYLWDLHVNHIDSLSGAFVPVYHMADSYVSESPRVISRKVLRNICKHGVDFTLNEGINGKMAAIYLCPRPIYKFSQGVDIPHDAPSPMRYLLGRSSISERYIRK